MFNFAKTIEHIKKVDLTVIKNSVKKRIENGLGISFIVAKKKKKIWDR